jgi:hypothetical protein
MSDNKQEEFQLNLPGLLLYTGSGIVAGGCVYSYLRKLQEIHSEKLLANIQRNQLPTNFLKRNLLGFIPYTFYTLGLSAMNTDAILFSLFIPLLYPLRLISTYKAIGLDAKEILNYKNAFDIRVFFKRESYRGLILSIINSLVLITPVLNCLIIPLENIRYNFILSKCTQEKMDGYRDSFRWNYNNNNLWRGALWYMPFLFITNGAALINLVNRYGTLGHKKDGEAIVGNTTPTATKI